MHIHETNKYQGSGLEKGYKFVLHTGNMIFIDKKYFDQLNISYNNELENFRTNFGAK